jgi:hypothetical protein
MHTVADLLCMGCQQLGRKTTLGWMYIKAKERDQQYKEGGSDVLSGCRRRVDVCRQVYSGGGEGAQGE